MSRKIGAECVGAFLLVFVGVGFVVLGIAGKAGAGHPAGRAGSVVGVAVAFGLVLVALAYAFGPHRGLTSTPP